MTRKLNVEIDRDRCVGNAMCRTVAPKAFVADDYGLSVVGQPDSESEQDLIEAASICPTGAITLRDAATGEQIEPY